MFDRLTIYQVATIREYIKYAKAVAFIGIAFDDRPALKVRDAKRTFEVAVHVDGRGLDLYGSLRDFSEWEVEHFDPDDFILLHSLPTDLPTEEYQDEH